MTEREKHIQEFLAEASGAFQNLLGDLAKKYEVEDDYLYMLCLGTYNNETEDQDKLIISMSADVDDEMEFSSLHDAALQIFIQMNDKPDTGTIDWWIKNYGNGSIN